MPALESERRDRPELSTIPISLEMAEAGGRLIAAALDDPDFLGKPNAAGELAARVFRAMRPLECGPA